MTTTPITIIFDMDGTLCSTYDVPNWLEMLRKYDSTPYAIAKPMWDFARLNAAVIALMEIGVEIKIVSWCSKESTKDFDDHVREVKRNWLNENGFPFNSCRITPYGYPKEYLRNKDAYNILIDDNPLVRENFCRFENCEAIDPTKVDIIEWLENLYKGE